MVPHVLNVMMAFREQIVIHVPPLLVIVHYAHKMELHVVAVKVDFMLTQTLVNKTCCSILCTCCTITNGGGTFWTSII